MSIKIETRKIVDSYGEQQREIIKITGCLGDNDLPGLYRNGEHYARAGTNAIRFKAYVKDIEGTMSEARFQESLEELKLCGNALHEARKKLAEMREAWTGDETFIV